MVRSYIFHVLRDGTLGSVRFLLSESANNSNDIFSRWLVFTWIICYSRFGGISKSGMLKLIDMLRFNEVGMVVYMEMTHRCQCGTSV